MSDKTIDPVYVPSVLEHAMAMFDDMNFDALKAEPRLRVLLIKSLKQQLSFLRAVAENALAMKEASSLSK